MLPIVPDAPDAPEVPEVSVDFFKRLVMYDHASRRLLSGFCVPICLFVCFFVCNRDVSKDSGFETKMYQFHEDSAREWNEKPKTHRARFTKRGYETL